MCSAIGQLTQLRFLNAMNNRLQQLPDELCQLSQLYRLGLKGNELRTLPEAFGELTSLVELFLTKNELRSLPASTGSCASLVKLQVRTQLRFLATGALCREQSCSSCWHHMHRVSHAGWSHAEHARPVITHS